MNERSPQTIGSIIEYMCMVAYRKFITRARGETIRKRLLNKKFLFDVSDKENMQRLEGGFLGDVEARELKGFVQDLRKRGIAHDGPDGIHIPALETMGEPSEDDDSVGGNNDAPVSEADAILKDAAARAAFARKIGSSSKVQRTSPHKLRAYLEIAEATFAEVPIPNEKDDIRAHSEVIVQKSATDDRTNDENKQTVENDSTPKRTRYC